METVHLIISGKVQGVFYRASAQKKAVELNIKGWIKNTRKGDVEAMVTGEGTNVDRFVEWCRSGPDRAIVSGVAIHKVELRDFESFRVER